MCKEYIDREAAFNAILKLVPKVDGDGYCWVIRGDAAAAIDAIPATDVRPVVRGRDCLHYEMGVCLKIYDDGAANKDAWQERKLDDYCSYGEDRNVPTNCRTDLRPTPMSGANEEES